MLLRRRARALESGKLPTMAAAGLANSAALAPPGQRSGNTRTHVTLIGTAATTRLAKYNMLAVQPRRVGRGDKELRATTPPPQWGRHPLAHSPDMVLTCSVRPLALAALPHEQCR